MKIRPITIPNKKANSYVIILYFLVMFVVLFVGFLMIVGSSILNWTFDEVVPELNNLGMIDNFNATETSSFTIDTMNTIVQSFTFLTGVLYMLMLIATFGVVVIIRRSPNRILMGLYFVLALALIMGCILVSNIYEEFATGTDELATRLQEHTVLNFMILYSPMIFSIVVFATGIIIFSGLGEEEIV